MPKIVWVHGKYLRVLGESYGGSERSRHLIRVFSGLYPSAHFYHVVYSEPFGNRSESNRGVL
jgi:hypothetical protein